MYEIKIADKIVGINRPCFIIAEAGVNHNGSLKIAKQLVDAAKEAGVDAVKFQTYLTEELVTEDAKQAKYQTENIGKKETQFEMLKKLELSFDDFRELKKYCDKKQILFMSTAHSPSAVDFLNDLIPAYKIGSGDFTNLPVLLSIAKKSKPIILSVGMCTMDEIKFVTSKIKSVNKDLVILHCTTSYPCPKNQVNLSAMKTIEDVTGCLVGYSDHTEGIEVSVMAASLGATVIEKHFTLDRNMEGPDHKASLEPSELKQMVKEIREGKKYPTSKEILGKNFKEPNQTENDIAKVARKSIFAKVDIKKGTKITENMLDFKRPGDGISPLEYEEVIKRKAKKDIGQGIMISWNQLE